MNLRTPEETASAWYRTAEVGNAIARSGNGDCGSWDEVPEDVYSAEFAEWMASHLRRAMVKGFQLAGRTQKDTSGKENKTG